MLRGDTGDVFGSGVAHHEIALLIEDCDAITHTVENELQNVGVASGRREIGGWLAIGMRQRAHGASAAPRSAGSFEFSVTAKFDM